MSRTGRRGRRPVARERRRFGTDGGRLGGGVHVDRSKGRGGRGARRFHEIFMGPARRESLGGKFGRSRSDPSASDDFPSIGRRAGEKFGDKTTENIKKKIKNSTGI